MASEQNGMRLLDCGASTFFNDGETNRVSSHRKAEDGVVMKTALGKAPLDTETSVYIPELCDIGAQDALVTGGNNLAPLGRLIMRDRYEIEKTSTSSLPWVVMEP